LQRLQGKCISFTLAVPSARLYTNAMNAALSRAAKNGHGVMPLDDPLRREIEHCGFLDGWEDVVPWRSERHLQLSLATDASLFKWGATLLTPGGAVGQALSDFWPTGDVRPIHLKETHALIKAIESLADRLANHRLDVYVDNMAFMGAWNRQGSRDPLLAELLKQLFQLTCSLNIDLKLQYIASAVNPADAPSRLLTWSDAMLAPHVWQLVEKAYGPHTVDMMALDSNVMVSTKDGQPLQHFTPHPTPGTDGVNVFAQVLSPGEAYYCYPPICLVGPFLAFLRHSAVTGCTVVVIPRIRPTPWWWPILREHVRNQITIGSQGQKGVLLVPTTSGFTPNVAGLKWDLVAYSLQFGNH
jgi:hypothetical protein